MLKGSAAVLTHWAGEKRTDTSARSHQLAAVAAQGPAGAHALFRKENLPTSRYETSGSGIKDGLVAPLPLSFVKGFFKVPAHGTNPWTIMVKWGRRERKGRKWEGSGVLGFGKLHDGQGGRQNSRLAVTAPQHRRAQLSPPPRHSINSFPLWQISWAANRPQKVSSFNHTQHPVCITITFWILQNPGLFQRYNLGNKYSPPRSCIKLL